MASPRGSNMSRENDSEDSLTEHENLSIICGSLNIFLCIVSYFGAF